MNTTTIRSTSRLTALVFCATSAFAQYGSFDQSGPDGFGAPEPSVEQLPPATDATDPSEPLAADQPPPGAGRMGRSGGMGGGAMGGGYGGGGMAGGYGNFGGGGMDSLDLFAESQSPGRPLIVATEAMAEKPLAEAEEDLAVMSRILAKTIRRSLGPDGPATAMGIFLAHPSGPRPPQAILIEGFGVLFQFQVNASLTPPPPKAEPEPSTEPDSEWENAKRELYGQAKPTSQAIGALSMDKQMMMRYGLIPPEAVNHSPYGETVAASRESAGQPYQAQRVARLKRQLVETLENATNIRSLQPTDHIVVVVRGGARQPLRPEPASTLNRLRNSMGQAPLGGYPDEPRPSTLTIRVTKKDVDSLAAGRMSLSNFAEKAIVQTY